MRPLFGMLVAVALCAGAALAQYSTTPTVTTAVPAGVSGTPATICPTPLVLPAPCAAILAPSVTGDPTILVLGSEERFALENLPVRRLGWRDAPSNFQSIFDPQNPLTHNHINAAVSRHGNPYYPYYALPDQARVAGSVERFRSAPTSVTTLPGYTVPSYTPAPTSTGAVPVYPGSVTSDMQGVLTSVRNQYSTFTPQQAVAMGYQPIAVTGLTTGVSQIYINRSMIDNCFNAAQPEAFIFSSNGRLLGVQYLMAYNQPLIMFGQQMSASTLVPGAQQLTVWLYASNPSGMFANTNMSV